MSRTWLVVLCLMAVAGTVASMVKALRARAKGERYVFAWWDGVPGLYGRSVAPRVPLATSVVLAVLAILLATEAPARFGFFRMGPRQFTFTMPNGWVAASATDPTSNTATLPPDIVQSLTKTRFSAAAFDVAHRGADGRCAGAMAIERPGSVVASAALVESESKRTLSDGARFAPGFDVGITSKELPVVAGSQVGLVTARVSRPEGGPPALTILIYVVPARTEYAVVSYFIPADRLASYRAEVDASIESIVASARRD